MTSSMPLSVFKATLSLSSNEASAIRSQIRGQERDNPPPLLAKRLSSIKRPAAEANPHSVEVIKLHADEQRSEDAAIALEL